MLTIQYQHRQLSAFLHCFGVAKRPDAASRRKSRRVGLCLYPTRHPQLPEMRDPNYPKFETRKNTMWCREGEKEREEESRNSKLEH